MAMDVYASANELQVSHEAYVPKGAKKATETVMGYKLLDVLFFSTVHLTPNSSMGKSRKMTHG